MSLFFIAHTDDENFDLFVWEENKPGALKRWHAWMADNFDDNRGEPDRVFIVPCDRPDGTAAGVLEWHKDVVQV